MTHPNQTQDAAPAARTGWLALAGLWLVYAGFGAVAASIAPLLPEIRQDLGVSSTTMGAIMGAWPLVYIFAAIPAGLVLDRIGPRSGLFVAALVIASSGLMRAMAEGPVTMLLAVALFGLGGPLVSTGAPKLIALLFQGPRRGTAMGIYITGPAIGSILSLSLTQSWLLPLAGHWRGVMLIYAGAALATGLIWLLASRGLGHAGAGNAAAPFDPGAMARLAGERAILMVLAMAIGIFYINHALNNWLPAVLRAAGMEPAEAGRWATVPMLVGLLASLSLPRFATPARRLPMLAGLFCCSLVASLLILLTTGTGLLIGLALQGLARGTMNTIAMLVLVERPEIPPDRIGLAGGLFFSAAEIGGMLGPFGFGLLRDTTGSFDAPLLTLSVVSGALLALCWALHRLGSPSRA